MKKLLDYLARPVLELAGKIPYKRYVYFTAGVLLACAALMATLLGRAPVWAAVIVSATVVTLAALWKEYWHDAKPEPRDLVRRCSAAAWCGLRSCPFISSNS